MNMVLTCPHEDDNKQWNYPEQASQRRNSPLCINNNQTFHIVDFGQCNLDKKHVYCFDKSLRSQGLESKCHRLIDLCFLLDSHTLGWYCCTSSWFGWLIEKYWSHRFRRGLAWNFLNLIWFVVFKVRRRSSKFNWNFSRESKFCCVVKARMMCTWIVFVLQQYWQYQCCNTKAMYRFTASYMHHQKPITKQGSLRMET